MYICMYVCTCLLLSRSLARASLSASRIVCNGHFVVFLRLLRRRQSEFCSELLSVKIKFTDQHDEWVFAIEQGAEYIKQTTELQAANIPPVHQSLEKLGKEKKAETHKRLLLAK